MSRGTYSSRNRRSARLRLARKRLGWKMLWICAMCIDNYNNKISEYLLYR